MGGTHPQDLLALSTEVAEALGAGRPVVALETTLVTHGFPRPAGLELGLELEETVRREGAIPATVGVLDGTLCVGLSRAELARLAAAPAVVKLNPGNLAAGVAAGEPGSTTVAATLVASHAAGIRVLTTGGIGGVHRGAGRSGDISADLTALARFPVAVVCSGAKAILDLPRTLEALETLGVPVFGNRTEGFPAFYRRDSGLPLERRFETLGELAAATRTHFDLGLPTGIVIANPIPEKYEMPGELYERALGRALKELAQHNIRGRDVTPFLLERLRDLTSGKSTFSNRALLLKNAVLASRLAGELARS